MSADSSAAAILDALRRGVRTTSELREASGLSRKGVECAIARLNKVGHEISNVRGPGGHHDGLYVLMTDADACGPRVCRAPDCTTQLSRSNRTPYCRCHLADVALVIFMETVCEFVDEAMGEEADDEQLALCL